MAAKARRRWALAVGALVLTAALVLTIGALGQRRYAFIDRFGGKRDVQQEIEVQGIAEGMGGLPPNSIVIRCYAFNAPPEKVAAAMTQELTRDGWTVTDKDKFEIDFVRDPEMAMFSYEGGYLPGSTCVAILSRRRNWFLDQWEALKERLGIE